MPPHAASHDVPWLWLYGPPGVGKSSLGYELFSRLAADGTRVGFVEMDQIGMCMPAPRDVQSAAKADNVLAMLGNLGGVGADGVVVSGDIAGPAMGDVLRRAPTRPTLCRLRADHDVVVERLAIRESLQYAEVSRTYDDDYAPPIGDLEVVTHPGGVDELATHILTELGPWPPMPRPVDGAVTDTPAAPAATALAPPPIDCSALLVTGPRAVGKSTVAWQVFMHSVTAGVRSAYLDLEQLGFVAPATTDHNLQLKLANVAACWEAFRRQGAQRFLLCGSVDGAAELAQWRRLLPSLRVVALKASAKVILDRARCRSRRKEIWLPGDDLFGAPDSELLAIAQSSATFTGDGADLVLDTDDAAPAELAEAILGRALG